MDQIRILHASDLHIAEIAKTKTMFTSRSIWSQLRSIRHRCTANSYDPMVLRAFAEFVKSESPLNAILFTGDIATTGAYKNLAIALRFFSPRSPEAWIGLRVSRFGEPSLGDIKTPIWIMPGNHDRFEPVKPKFHAPGGKRFHDVFSNYWDNDVRAYPVLAGRGISVAVIGADFSLKSSNDSDHRLGRFGQGKVYQEILENLATATRTIHTAFPNKRLVLFWAVHFPPLFENEKEYMRLIESETLVSAATELRVSAILSGHTHVRREYQACVDESVMPPLQRQETLENKENLKSVNVFCAGTASEFDTTHPNHFQIIEVSEAFIGIKHYEFDREAGAFLLSETNEHEHLR